MGGIFFRKPYYCDLVLKHTTFSSQTPIGCVEETRPKHHTLKPCWLNHTTNTLGIVYAFSGGDLISTISIHDPCACCYATHFYCFAKLFTEIKRIFYMNYLTSRGIFARDNRFSSVKSKPTVHCYTPYKNKENKAAANKICVRIGRTWATVSTLLGSHQYTVVSASTRKK